ncbi:M15 family metallopeptidase [Acinetobacter sp.]|uniref:M15 family metallopeptidase n=1 Tax=Acinetobacter sp. TaxID=472 RepID=UPI003D054A31
MSNTPKKFVLSKLSLGRLEGVNTDLVKIVKRAIAITQQDFMVVEGVRSKEQCYINYGKGRTAAQCIAKGVPAKYAQPKLAKVTWLTNPLSSKHVTGKAVDLVPYPVDWDDVSKFDQIAKAMFAAAKELGVSIRWGADWDNDGNYREKGEYDSPHFEL